MPIVKKWKCIWFDIRMLLWKILGRETISITLPLCRFPSHITFSKFSPENLARLQKKRQTLKGSIQESVVVSEDLAKAAFKREVSNVK